MGEKMDLDAGDEWPRHYRGFTLQVSPNENVWWQLYNGTDRLQLKPVPGDIVESLLELKRIGGRVHVTEDGDVLTRVEAESDEYSNVFVGSVDLQGELVPEDNPEYSIDLSPDGLSGGDLWPSVYDGSRYSFAGDHVWWHNGETHRRHPVTSELPRDVQETLQRFKPKGGSFRITPQGDVITLIEAHPTPGEVKDQFSELPRVVQNIIRLRKERGVEMLPIYVGSLDETPLKTEEPSSLTDDLSEEEQKSLASWASGLGRTTNRSASDHQSSGDAENKTRSDEKSSKEDEEDPKSPKEKLREFDDDPVEWIHSSVEDNNSEERE